MRLVSSSLPGYKLKEGFAGIVTLMNEVISGELNADQNI